MNKIKIGFLVHRNLYYKYFGSIIDEALKRGHEVVCLHDYSFSGMGARTGNKRYQFPLLNQVPEFRFGKPKTIAFYSEKEFYEIIAAQKIKVIVCLNFYPKYIALHKELKKKGVSLVAIQATVDMAEAGLLHLPDKYLIYTDFWLSLALQYAEIRGIIKQAPKVRSVGFPEIDQLDMVDPPEVRKDWGIPEGKPVVLYLPFPCLKDGNLRTRFGYRKWDRKIVKAVKQFCDNNNAYLLVKTRRKNPIAGYLKRKADKILYDDEFYPATIIKCLKIADVCINFYSSVPTEAIPAGVPNICIAPTPEQWASMKQPFWKLMLEKGKEFYDFDGVSYKLSISEAIETLPKKLIKDFPFNSERRIKYIKKFVGSPTGNSQRAVNEIENL